MYEFLEATHRSYPNMTHIYSIGKSLQGKDLWVMAVSSHSPDKHVLLRPETKYVGNIHGNEATSREMLIRFIDLLLTQYGEDDSITHLMDTTRVHVMPTMNPDGYGITSKWNCSGVYGRYNMAQVDLNRDFPDYFNPTYQTREMMQPESGAVADWIDSTQFVLSAGFHGGALVANYPYDSNSEPQSWMSYGAPSICPDDATFQYLAKAYSYNHRDMTNSSTCRTFRDGITNGAEWYVALGTMQDYNYVWGGCMDLTLEIGCCKHPPYSHIERYWLDNKLAMIEYLRKVDLGVKGIVTDKTGKPVPNAVIQVNSTLSVRTTPLGNTGK
ncbi:hypothetical protein EB796_003558 [Bugula neritina]|uniref:Peptidase M14 domain-containing protein n=1 Tax=Bugula neritina TaxID=10212 RepID=A0A7J7KKJ3_BUGNE|nr:hypothetical protein EB796_003558 [Bugula neritina]